MAYATRSIHAIISLSKEADLPPTSDRLDPAMNAELAVDLLNVPFNGARGNGQRRGNVIVGMAGGQKEQDLFFSIAERLYKAWVVYRPLGAAGSGRIKCLRIGQKRIEVCTRGTLWFQCA